MLWLLLTPLYVVLVPILLLVLKDIMCYVRYLLYYKSQGIKYEYNPIMGLIGATYKKIPNSKDIFTNLKRLVADKYKNEDVVCSNYHGSSSCYFMITGKNLFKELMIKELQFTKKVDIFNGFVNMGFFFDEGAHAVKQRAIFSNFFQPQNLKDNTPGIQKILSEYFGRIREELWGDQKGDFEFKNYNLNELFVEMFAEVVNEIMFGHDDYPIIDGLKLPNAIENLLRDFLTIRKSPLNLLTGGIMEKYGLHPLSKQVVEQRNKIDKELVKLIKNREAKNKESGDYGVNLLDLMLKYNSTCDKGDELTYERMIGNIILLQVAGADTTQNFSRGFIKDMSARPEHLEMIYKEIPKYFKSDSDFAVYDNYEKSKYINCLLLEFLRLRNPAGITFTRKFIKDTKLGKYNFKKNDLFLVPIIGYHFKEEDFPNAKSFDGERFSEENKKGIKRNSFIPFYDGKRSCIGRYMADQMMRMIAINFFSTFEIKNTGSPAEYIHQFVQGVKDCDVLLRPKSN